MAAPIPIRTPKPPGAGHRLRLGTRKGNVPELAAVGVIGLVMAVITTVALVAQGRLDTMFISAEARPPEHRLPSPCSACPPGAARADAVPYGAPAGPSRW